MLTLLPLEEVEVFGVVAEVEATIDACLLLAARLTAPTPAERMVLMFEIDDTGRAGRREEGESMALLRNSREKTWRSFRLWKSITKRSFPSVRKNQVQATMPAAASFSLAAPSARSVAGTSGRTIVASVPSSSRRSISGSVR